MSEGKPPSKFDKLFQKAEPAPEGKKAPGRRVVKKKLANMGGGRKTAVAAVQAAARPLGRPPGKRSDPAWKQFSVLLKRDTQREAAAILRDKDEGLDLSGLVQSLLEGWVKRQKS